MGRSHSAEGMAAFAQERRPVWANYTGGDQDRHLEWSGGFSPRDDVSQLQGNDVSVSWVPRSVRRAPGSTRQRLTLLVPLLQHDLQFQARQVHAQEAQRSALKAKARSVSSRLPNAEHLPLPNPQTSGGGCSCGSFACRCRATSHRPGAARGCESAGPPYLAADLEHQRVEPEELLDGGWNKPRVCLGSPAGPWGAWRGWA